MVFGALVWHICLYMECLIPKDKFVNVWDDWPWHYIKFNDQQSQDQFEQYIRSPDCSIDDRGMQESFERDWPTFATSI